MMTPEQRQARNMKTTVKSLVSVIEQAVDGIDRLAKQPSTFDRGKGLAAIANYLEMAKDQAKHFALGKSLRPRKRQHPTSSEGTT